jgi:cobalt-zinc-cadmium efflux system outer membrane protein
MARLRASGWLIPAVSACFFLTSCTRIEPGPELHEADAAMERATGLRTQWTSLPELQELRPDESGTVALDQVLSLALANNRALRGDLAVIGQAKADLVQAGLLSNPMLSLMFRFPAGGGVADFAFGLSKDFADLWLIPSRKRAAQAMLQQRVLSFTDAAIALATDVKTNYYNLQYLLLAAELEEENLRILQEATDIAQARFRAGESQLDVNLLRARYLEANLDLIQFRSDSRVTRQMLLRQMGVARAPDDWRPHPMLPTAPITPALTDESAFIEAALLQRLDVQAVHWELESAVADFEQQQLRVMQSLGIGLNGERMQKRTQPGRKILADTVRASIANGKLTAPDIMSAGQRRLERAQMIDFLLGPTIEVPLPIFDQNQAQIAKAQFRARELQQRYEEVEQRVIEGVRSALTQRRLAEDRVRIFEESLVPLQVSNLRLAEAAYQAGRESILTVLLAQGELIRTRLAHAVAVRELAVSAANLERQLSGRVPEFLIAPPATQPTSAPAEGQGAQASPGSDPIVTEAQTEPAGLAAEPQRESR